MRLLLVSPGSDVATGDIYTGLVPALRRRGHEVIEYQLSDRIDRQASWLKYNYDLAVKRNPAIPKPTWADILYLAGERVIPLALREQPDLVLVVSGMYFHPDLLVLLKRAGLRLGLLLTESPYDDLHQYRVLPGVDIAWTNERHSVQVLRYANPNVHYLPHAYDPERHRPDLPADDDVPAHDVVLVATAFMERINLLAAVDWTGIDLGLYGNWAMLKGLPWRDARGRFAPHPLKQYVRGGFVSNDQAAAFYRKAKVGLNLYRTSVGYGRNVPSITTAESLNPRALELAACGVFTLSDDRAEVQEVFGDAVPTFKTPQELGDLIRGWLADDYERELFASTLPGLVKGRTFDAMAAQIEADLASLLTSAPHGQSSGQNGVVPQHERQEVAV